MTIAILLPLIPLSVLLSTKGLMFLLLSAYGGAMWTFLSGAPRVFTILVPNLDEAKPLYEKLLQLPEAELPLHYYYGYEQSLGSFDTGYLAGDLAMNARRSTAVADTPGLWYQLSDTTQLHIMVGESKERGTYPRHVSFEREGVKAILKHIQKLGSVPYTVRGEKPFVFWVRNPEGKVIEFAEAQD